MVESRARVKEALLSKLKIHQKAGKSIRTFDSESDIEAAVDLVLSRFEELMQLKSRSGSLGSVMEYKKVSRDRRQSMTFPQNQIPLQSLVLPSSRSGLCPLPPREDCLSAMGTIYPERRLEDDLTIENVHQEPALVPRLEHSATSIHRDLINVKRMKFKDI
jgi:hypothetical protein